MSKLSVVVERFRPMRSNSLHGFIDIVVPALRLRVRDATVHKSHGRKWVGLPARPQLDRDGAVRRDDRGKIAYSSILQFTDRATGDAFSARVIEALLAAYPNAFEEVAP